MTSSLKDKPSRQHEADRRAINSTKFQHLYCTVFIQCYCTLLCFQIPKLTLPFMNKSEWSYKVCNFKKWIIWICSRFSIGPFTLAKTKIQKTWVFCCTVYTARKTHNIRGFWHEKRMREKTRISYLCFGIKWCACATSLYLWPYTCSAHYVAGRGRVIPLKVTYHVTKNPNNTNEIGASVYIDKKPVKFRRSFKKSRCGGGFFDSFFFCVFRGSCLATFNEKPECEKDSGFFMPV